MNHDPSHDPARPLGRSEREPDGDYVEKDIATTADEPQPTGEYVDKDVATDTPELEREGEYFDKDVTEADTHAPKNSYVNKDIPR